MTPEQIVNELAKNLMSRNNMVQAGRYLAEGFSSGGNSTGFSPSNPTGQGAAGGRGFESSSGAEKGISDEIAVRKKNQKEIETELRVRKILNAQYAKQKTLVKNLSSTLKHIDPAMRTFRKEMGTVGDVISDRLQHVSDSFEDYEKEVKFWTKIRSKSGRTLTQVEERRARILRILNNGTKHEALVKRKLVEVEEERTEILKEANEELDKNTTLFEKLGGKAAMFGFALEAATKLVGDVNAQLRFGTIGGIAEQQKMSILLGGVDPEALSELSSSSRMATIAMGGQAEMNDALIARQWEMYKVTGDFTESARHQLEMYQLLGEAGIRPTLAEFDNVQSSFDYLHRMAGVTAEQFRGMIKQLSEDSEIRYRLQSINKKDRAAAMAGLTARLKENVALGMTEEQAMRAATALGKLSGDTAKERFKRAAQLQMAAGALGVSGGAEAARIHRLGERATEDEREVFEGFMKRMADARATSRVDSVGTEIAVDAIMNKTGLEGTLGKDSPFITTMTEALRPDGEIAKGIKTTAESTADTVIAINGLATAAGGIKSNTAGGSALAALIGGGVALGGRRGLSALLKGGKNLFGMGGGAAAGAGGKAALQTAGKVGLRSLPMVGAVLAGGKDLYDLSQGDTSGANTGALIGTVLGGAVGALGGPMGIAIGAGIGNFIGEGVGGLFDGEDPAQVQQEALTSNTADLLNPANRTAVGVENLAELLVKNNEYQEIQVKSTLNMISAQESRDRLRALQANGQIAVQDA